MKKICLTILIVLSLSVLAACGNSSNPPAEPNSGQDSVNPKTIKINIEEVKGDAEAVYAEKFKELLEAQSNGAFKVEVFYLGQLGDGTDTVELCQNGAVEMILAAAAATGSLVPESNAYGIHYLFPDTGIQDVQAFLDQSKGVELLEEAFYENNLVTLDWTSEGYNYWCMKDRVTTPGQMKGYKIRTMPAPIYTAFYNAYGANSTTVAFSETYSALQLNMVNGISNAMCVNVSMKYYEVTNYLIAAYQDLYIFGTFVNKNFWESLNSDEQALIQSVVKETSDYYNANYLTVSTQEQIQQFIDNGSEFYELSEAEKQAFKDIAVERWDKDYGDLYGSRAKEILNLLKDELAQWQ